LEVIFWIGIIWFILTLYGNYKEKQEQEAMIKRIAKERQDNIFKSKVINDKIVVEDSIWDTFKIDIKGIVEGSHDNFDMRFIVRMFDITDGEYPILCTLEDFQAVDSRVFFYESNIEKLPYKETIFSDWFSVINIPKIFLEFPKKGNRKIQIKVFAIDANTRNILAEDNIEVTYLAEEKGYIDRQNDTKYFEEMVIKTAMLVSASDGTMDDDEARVVKDWIKKRLSYFDESRQTEEKNRLNGYIKDIFFDIESGDVDIYEILEGIENIASEGEKFELFQLCLDVAQADGEADEAELKIVYDIADYIKLDRSQFRSMIEKTLPVTIHTSEANADKLLDIDSSMTNKEIKKYLREQYKKWNARVSSKDVKIREQAEKMINLIAEARKKYI